MKQMYYTETIIFSLTRYLKSPFNNDLMFGYDVSFLYIPLLGFLFGLGLDFFFTVMNKVTAFWCLQCSFHVVYQTFAHLYQCQRWHHYFSNWFTWYFLPCCFSSCNILPAVNFFYLNLWLTCIPRKSNSWDKLYTYNMKLHMSIMFILAQVSL